MLKYKFTKQEKKDIELAIPKIKSGGLLCGHDCEGFAEVNSFTEFETN